MFITIFSVADAKLWSAQTKVTPIIRIKMHSKIGKNTVLLLLSCTYFSPHKCHKYHYQLGYMSYVIKYVFTICCIPKHILYTITY